VASVVHCVLGALSRNSITTNSQTQVLETSKYRQLGVVGLLTQLGPLCRQANIYVAARGDIVGIDACVWMHQPGYAYARDIMNNDYTTLGTALRQRTHLVIGKGLNIVLVFDGGRFPAKSLTDHARAERSQVQLAKVQYDGPAPNALAK
jgi:hypothetical protein